MIRLLTLIVAFTISSVTAQAQDNSDDNAVCKILATHSSTNNVVYQAGVDVNGNPVVPAQLNSDPIIDSLNIVKVPLNINLAQRVSRLSGQGIQMDAPLGMLEIHQDGKIKYNGEDWTKPVMTLCGKSYKEVTVNEIMVPKEQAASMIEPAATQEVDEVQILRQEVEALRNELAVKSAEEALAIPEVSPPELEDNITMPAVKAPSIEMLDEVTPTKERMQNMTRAKLSPPAKPIQPLIGIPKAAPTEPEVIKGQDYRDYNE